MVFWITAAALTLVVAAILVTALMRGKADEEHPAAYDLRVYRDQLKEVDRDLARGVIGAEDAERIRAEVGRRVLAADAQLQAATAGAAQPRGATMVLSGLVLVALVGGSFALYPVLGQPGTRDLPLKTRIAASNAARDARLSQAEYEARLPPAPAPDPDPRFAELMDKLRKTVGDRPDDLQGQQLLARNEAALGNFKAAYTAQQAVIRIKGDQSTAEDHAVLAELLIAATGGYVSPQAEDALRKALETDATNQPARYFTGLMLIQNDRPDIAFRLWKGLLEEGPETAPWVPIIRDQIGELAWRAGVDYTPPPPAAMPGPSAADMANAADMTPEERQEMVRSMVEQLNDRLATEGGTPQEWARLILALGVLGERDRAAAIWAEAQQVFAANAEALAIVRTGAEQAGVAEAAPAALPGPTRDDVANAADMTAEERQEMIRGMVGRLAERLASDGGNAQEWARLITSQAMLGDRDAALQALADARAALSGDDAATATLDAAAAQAGLTE